MDKQEVAKFKEDILLPAEAKMKKLGMPIEEIRKETSFALQILNDPKNAYLATSSPESILRSIVNIAQVGLTLNPVSKEAYLIPRKSGKTNGVQCCLEPSYIGLVKLITDTGGVTSIQTNLINEEDEFTLLHTMSGADFRHVPTTKGETGPIVGVYCVARLKSGEFQFEHMTRTAVEAIRETSESWKAFMNPDKKLKSCIWVDHEGEMYRKTCLKRITKYLPRSSQPFMKEKVQRLDNAVKLTNSDWEPSINQITLAEALIRSSTLIDSQKENYLRQLPTIRSYEIDMLIEHLQDHQLDPIQNGSVTHAKQIVDGTKEREKRDRDPEDLFTEK